MSKCPKHNTWMVGNSCTKCSAEKKPQGMSFGGGIKMYEEEVIVGESRPRTDQPGGARASSSKGPACAGCGSGCGGDFIEFNGKQYCDEKCLKCYHCKQVLDPSAIYTSGDRISCKEHSKKNFDNYK